VKTLTQHLAKQELLSRQQSAGTMLAILAALSPRQQAFIADPSRLKVICAGRRAGKSHVSASYMVIKALSKPNARILYLALTQQSGSDIISSLLKDLLYTHKIPHTIYTSLHKYIFPNGSTIRILGADTVGAKKRLRGVAFDLVLVDEGAFLNEMQDLVVTVLPATADSAGTICMMSSPGVVMEGLFYEACQGNQKEYWSNYHWTMRDNPFFQKKANNPQFATRAEEELDLACRMLFNGKRNHPSFVREYEGLWVRDDETMLYPYQQGNIIQTLPKWPKAVNGLGLDFGTTSANGLTVATYNEDTRELLFRKSYRKIEPNLDKLAEEIASLQTEFDIELMVGDTGGLGAPIVSELRRRFKLPILAANKQEKATYQRALASDLHSDYVKVYEPDCGDLLSEWKKLVKSAEGTEEKKKENHASDSALYIFRHLYWPHKKNYLPVPTEEERMIQQLVELAQQEQAEQREEMEGYR
jgi:hypothetical protein